MKVTTEDLKKAIKIFRTGVILYIVEVFLYSFILYKFWGWFITPNFQTAPAITHAIAAGLYLCTTFFKKRQSLSIKKEYIDTANAIASLFSYLISPFALLLLGYILKTIG